MPYVFTKSNGRVFSTVEDGSVDNTGSLTFIGKNYAGYGQILQQNVLYLLENFSYATAPVNPIQGQIWFDSGNLKLKVYDGNTFKGISFTSVANTQPTTAQEGDYWFNPSSRLFQIKIGEQFVPISGAGGGGGAGSEGAILTSVKDADGNSHAILKTVINNNEVSIFSYDSFAVNSSESIYARFPFIKRGLTLLDADAIGKTATSINGTLFWGTAATALKADKLLVDSTSTYFDATTSTTANTVVARGPGGEIWASNFVNATGLIGQGYWGSIGYTGSGSGYTGSAGSGYTGSAGELGYTGSGGGGGGGYTGSLGYTGSASTVAGYYGSKGTTGYTGSRGSAAAVGPPILYNVTSPYTAGGKVFVSSAQPVATSAGDVWFDISTNGNLSSSGWTTLPNGLKVAWGITPSNSENVGAFNVAYTAGVSFAQVFSVQLTLINPSGITTGGWDIWPHVVNISNPSLFQMLIQAKDSGAAGTAAACYYFAVGR